MSPYRAIGRLQPQQTCGSAGIIYRPIGPVIFFQALSSGCRDASQLALWLGIAAGQIHGEASTATPRKVLVSRNTGELGHGAELPTASIIGFAFAISRV